MEVRPECVRFRPRLRPTSLGAAALALVLFPLVPASRAEVHLSRQEALARAFPKAGTVVPHDLFLTRDQATELERHAKVHLESRMVTVYRDRDAPGDGYALFDTRVVRSLSATLLVVVSGEATIRAVHVAAFHEPPDYQPPPRWLSLLVGRDRAAPLAVGRDLAGITGATMSARAASDACRLALALHPLVIGSSDPGTDGPAAPVASGDE